MAAKINVLCSSQNPPCSHSAGLTQRHITVKSLDLMRYSVSLGGISGYKLSRSARSFYRSLVKMALVEDGGARYVASADYLTAEPSFKRAISFYMGMIAAKAVTEKCHGISLLLHLGDKRIVVSPKNGERPDFFGIPSRASGKYMLVEAKGTVSDAASTDTLKNASRQLKNIATAQFNGQTITTFERHIVCSALKNRELTYYDIDPPETGNTALSFDVDKAVYHYYVPVLEAIAEGAHEQDTDKHGGAGMGIEATTVELGSIRLGMERRLLEVLRSYAPCEVDGTSDFEGLYDELRLILNECAARSEPTRMASEQNNGLSIGLDGIIAFKN